MSDSTIEVQRSSQKKKDDPTGKVRDLSSEIEVTVPREPQDRVRCVHVFDDFYRCNWWSPSPGATRDGFAPDWATGATHVVRKSMFLRADADGGTLRITEIITPVRP